MMIRRKPLGRGDLFGALPVAFGRVPSLPKNAACLIDSYWHSEKFKHGLFSH